MSQSSNCGSSSASPISPTQRVPQAPTASTTGRSSCPAGVRTYLTWQVAWREADARSLPFPDATFDVVLSCVGVMFASDHQACASELLRVCRPGGTIGLVNWTPEGFIGQMLAVTRRYLAPPPQGARPAPWWGRPGYLANLLAGQVTVVTERREVVRIDRFADPAEFRDYFKVRYGPTIAAYRQIAAEPQRVAGLDRDLADLARRHDLGDGPSLVMGW